MICKMWLEDLSTRKKNVISTDLVALIQFPNNLNKMQPRFWLAEHKLSCDSNANRVARLALLSILFLSERVAAAGAKEISLARAHSNHYIIVRATHNDRIMNCIHVINKRAYKVGIWMTDWLADLFLFQQLSFSSRASLAIIYQNLIYGFDLCVARLFLRDWKRNLISSAATFQWRAFMHNEHFFASGLHDNIFGAHEWIRANELDKGDTDLFTTTSVNKNLSSSRAPIYYSVLDVIFPICVLLTRRPKHSLFTALCGLVTAMLFYWLLFTWLCMQDTVCVYIILYFCILSIISTTHAFSYSCGSSIRFSWCEKLTSNLRNWEHTGYKIHFFSHN